MAATLVSSSLCFGGKVNKYKHHSNELQCDMHFNVYIPPSLAHDPLSAKTPAVYFLSGLTCTEDNFITKSGAPQVAAELNLVLVCPDTSPRGVDIPGDSDSWDFGKGAGFYVDATKEPWRKHYRMFSYVTKELPEVLKNIVNIDEKRVGIMGHSMGGHGALVVALRNPGKYASCSAFSPIVNPSVVPWGTKAFSNYLSSDGEWAQYDATLLLPEYRGSKLPILIDQGTADSFLAGQLKTENFIRVVRESGNADVEASINMREGYDHSYWFISTFIRDHLAFHAKHLSSI